LWVPRAIRFHKTSLKQLRSSALFDTKMWKWVRITFRHLETSLHRLHQSLFQDVQKVECEFSEPFAYLKHYLSNFVQVAFFDSLDAENEFTWPFGTLKHRFSDFTSRFLRLPEGRLWVRTHYLPSGCLKKWLVKSMKRYFKVSKGLTNSFSLSWGSKKATCT
jgi:hypothetical protein